MLRKTEIGIIMVALVSVVICARQWHETRVERVALKEQIAQQQKANDAESANERKSAQILKNRIAEIEALKKKTKTAADAAKALPAALSSLPLPIKIELPPEPKQEVSARATGTESADTAGPTQSSAGKVRLGATASESPGEMSTLGDQMAAIARIPTQDLKPIYDAVENCKECELQLDSLQAQLAATKLRLQAAEKERDEALVIAKGGSRRTRFKRAIKWFVIGAAAGSLATHRQI